MENSDYIVFVDESGDIGLESINQSINAILFLFYLCACFEKTSTFEKSPPPWAF